MIDYLAAGVTEPEKDIIEFSVTQEDIDAIRKQYITATLDATGKPLGIHIQCSERQAVAMQIFLMTGKFKVGTFRAAKYSQSWHEYRPKTKKEQVTENASSV